MANNYDQPLPPGVQNLQNSSPLLVSSHQSGQHPPQPFQNYVNQNNPYYAENNLYQNYTSNMAHTPLAGKFHPQYASPQQAMYAPPLNVQQHQVSNEEQQVRTQEETGKIFPTQYNY